MINLLPIYTGATYEIDISGDYVIDGNNYHNSSILELSNISVSGSVIKEKDEEIHIKMNAKGKMKILDSVTLDEVWYDFEFKTNDNIEEFIQKDENYLDIIEVLWQNIVLEVPLRYTTVENVTGIQGDGWKLVSEEELKYNPFSALLNDKDRSD